MHSVLPVWPFDVGLAAAYDRAEKWVGSFRKNAMSKTAEQDSEVDMLHAMCGVDIKACKKALKTSNGDINAAFVQLVTSGQATVGMLNPDLCSDEDYVVAMLGSKLGKSMRLAAAGYGKRYGITKTQIHALRRKLSGKERPDRETLEAAALLRRCSLQLKHMSETKTPAAVWRHPTLGTFNREGDEICATVIIPAFRVYSYSSRPSSRRPSGKTVIRFTLKEQEDAPPKEHIALVEAVVRNASALATSIARSLWQDFQGKGRASGMWWHGDLDQVNENMDEELATEKDIYSSMRLQSITVRREFGKKPLAELDFRAALELEHGVGILTDGKKVVGIGYALDVTPYE